MTLNESNQLLNEQHHQQHTTTTTVTKRKFYNIKKKQKHAKYENENLILKHILYYN